MERVSYSAAYVVAIASPHLHGSCRDHGWLGPFLVFLDSTLPNRMFPKFLEQGIIPELRGFQIAAREPKLGAGRADFLLIFREERMFVEVKSVTLVEDGVALFPDAPTLRGRRHMAELANALEDAMAALVFVVQRPDALAFGPNAKVDPEFANIFEAALTTGVVAFGLVCSFDGFALHPVRALGLNALRLP